MLMLQDKEVFVFLLTGDTLQILQNLVDRRDLSEELTMEALKVCLPTS